MRVDMQHADGPLRANRFQDGQGDRMIAADAERDDARSDDAREEGFDVLVAAFERKARAHRNVADIRELGLAKRGDAQHMLVRADALDRAHGARPKSSAGAVGDAEVHGNADQREIEPAEIRQIGRLGAIGRVEQGRDVREGPFAPVAGELLFGDGAKMRVVHLAAGGVAIALAQALQFGVVDHFHALGFRRRRANRSARAAVRGRACAS